MAHFIRDILNPLGPEYGATTRVADSVAATQQAMDDMLELAMASDDETRMRLARQIKTRKQREAVGARRGRIARCALFATLAAAFIGVYQLGDDSSSLSGAYRAFMATPSTRVADATRAHARLRIAPDAQDSDTSDAAVARGEQVLRDSGMTNEQIDGAPKR